MTTKEITCELLMRGIERGEKVDNQFRGGRWCFLHACMWISGAKENSRKKRKKGNCVGIINGKLRPKGQRAEMDKD